MKQRNPSIALLFVCVNLYAPAVRAQASVPAEPGPQSASANGSEPSQAAVTANIALTTKYKFRGQDQGNTKWFSPALQGGFDGSWRGFYVGNWNSNVSFGDAAIEMDFYGGYKGEIAKDFGYDVGILQYAYPQKDRKIDFNTTELYGALAWQWLSVKYSHTVSKDYFGIGQTLQQTAVSNGIALSRPHGRNTGYVDFAVSAPVADKLTLNVHVGYTRYASELRQSTQGTTSSGVPAFVDYKAGLTYDLGAGFNVAAALTGATKRGFYGDVNKPRLILALAKSM